MATNSHETPYLTPHGPIYINGNGDFTPTNGVTGGSGTPSDPYIIGGWEIINFSSGITIRNTNAPFVIRGVYVYTEEPWTMGLVFSNVTSGAVENSTVAAWEIGASLSDSKDITISRSYVWGSFDFSLWISASGNVTIWENEIPGAGEQGIYVTSSNNLTIAGNTVYGSGLYQIMLTGGSKDVLVYHNNIIAEWPVLAWDDGGNVWDDGYPSGGNYWSNYGGVDNCSGPNQDVCPNSDGIGDTPHTKIDPGGSQDNYPLMNPFIPDLPPVPPKMLPAQLTGSGFENVSLSWQPSADDGAGQEDVNAYEVWYGDSYDSTATSYGLLASLPPGTTSYVHTDAGAGDPLSHFYQLRVIDAANQSSVAAEQAGKYAQFLKAGRRLISAPLEQDDWALDIVLQTVPWERAWAYAHVGGQGKAWLSNDRQKTWADLTALTREMALWIEVKEDAWWTIAGLVPTETQVSLQAGWNLIGYPSFLPRTVADLLAGVAYDTVEGYAEDPPYYVRTLGPGEPVDAGGGYWVLVPADAVLRIKN